MRLLILGASGGCGQCVTDLAAHRGHRVTALVRPSATFAPPAGVTVLRGEVLDRSTVDRALDGIDAVLCCLGIRRHRPSNPWSRLASPPDLTSRVASHLAEIMPRRGVRRIIAISAAGVGCSASKLSPINRWLFRHSNIGVAYADLELMEEALRGTELDWLAVRPATLTNGPPTGLQRVVPHYGLLTRIPRADVATWMLNAVERPTPFTERTPMIASRG
jgi:uncharacterized protein YbjT (DUF2867 family)